MPHRVRVRLDFELEIHEEGFPGWLDHIVGYGVNALIDDGHALGPVKLTRSTRSLHRVPEAEIRRREARAAKKAGAR